MPPEVANGIVQRCHSHGRRLCEAWMEMSRFMHKPLFALVLPMIFALAACSTDFNTPQDLAFGT